MPIRISGINSGMDTESIVKELVSAYSLKKETFVKAKTKLEWKQDKWKDLNQKIYNLYAESLSSMKYSQAYNKKATSVSDPTKATVIAGSNVPDGTHKLEILELAKTGYLTGDKLTTTGGKSTTQSTKLSELGFTSNGTIGVSVGGESKNITVDGNTTIQGFVNQLKDAGLSANFDEKNQRIFISAKESGVENDFTITGLDANGMQALSSMGLVTSSVANTDLYDKLKSYGVFDAPNVLNDAQTLANIKNILDDLDARKAENVTLKDEIAAHKDRITVINNKAQYAEHRKNADDLLEASAGGFTAAEKEEFIALIAKDPADLTALEASRLSTLEASASFSTEDHDKFKTASKAIVKFDESADAEGLATKADVMLAISQTNSGINPTAYQDYLDGLDDQINGATGYQTLIDQKEATISLNNDEFEDHKYIMQAEGVDNDAKAAVILDEVKNAVTALSGGYDSLINSGAKRVDGQDAKILLNDVEFTSSKNNITVNGMTITALNETDGTPVIISTSADTQGVYDNIKKFLTEYNTLMKEMDKLYNAKSSKGYEPLTDEEKDQMTDEEIKRWEEKIQDSLLRRDSSLSVIMSTLSGATSKVYEIDGKKYSLSSFGINTPGYLGAGENEKKLLHIDGDPDDPLVSGNANRLLEMLQSEPEVVEEFFKNLADDLYKELDKNMGRTELSSIYTAYNDKKLQDDINKMDKTIKKWEDKLEYYEKFYTDKFTAMEVALAKMQNNSNSLSQMMGM